MKARIDDALISPMDKEIACMRLLDRQAWVDIAAAVHCDRRTASRHFDRIKDII